MPAPAPIEAAINLLRLDNQTINQAPNNIKKDSAIINHPTVLEGGLNSDLSG